MQSCLNTRQSPYPVRLTIDKNTASAAETLVRFAKMYCDTTRTKVYGKENTWGAQNSDNCDEWILWIANFFVRIIS